jgi:hydroxyacylglutathione hydrolase
MELVPGVHLVGSGQLGMCLSHDDDCNIYLIDGGTDSVLVDAGCGLGAEYVLAAIAAAHAPPVSRILLTHAHPDHAAGAAGLAARLGAEICASAEVAEIVATADEVGSGLRVAYAAGLYPQTVRFLPTPVTTLDSETMRVGKLKIGVLPTPGHATGHRCYRLEVNGRVAIFTGDLVFARGRAAVLSTPDTDLRQFAASMQAIVAAEPDILFPGHCEPVMRGGVDHVQVAADAFSLAALPPMLT